MKVFSYKFSNPEMVCPREETSRYLPSAGNWVLLTKYTESSKVAAIRCDLGGTPCLRQSQHPRQDAFGNKML